MIILLVIGLVPLVWSAIVFGLRRMSRRNDIPQDRYEKLTLAMMLMPVVVGFGLVILAPYMPVSVTTPVLTYTGFDNGPVMAVTATVTPTKAPVDWLGTGLMLVAATYLLVAGSGVARLLWAQFKLHLIVAKSTAAHDLGEGVHLTSVTMPAFVFGSTVILPHQLLTKLTPAQVTMIVAHERAHLARSDTLYFAALSWIDALFWFNPFVRHQTLRGRLAAELACDAAVTRTAPQMRKAYAESLLTALKHTAGDVRQYAPAVISTLNSGEFQMRLSEIMHASPSPRKPRRLILGVAALLIVPLAGLQLTWAQTTVPKTASVDAPVKVTTPAMPTSIFTVIPTAGNLTNGYGMRVDPFTHKRRLHDGVDIAEAIGTPVYASGLGRVIRVDMSAYGYGHLIEINHGKGLVTRYMHLSDIDVHVGDQVQAGQLIAKSGNTGRSTGPHTHIGVFINGKPVDPAGLMPLPQATPS